MRFRDLGQGDSDAIAAFRCAVSGQPWTGATEQQITEYLAFALEQGDVEAIGLFDGDTLCGLVAWAIDPYDPSRWRCTTLAVARGYKRHGHATRLKHEMLARAEQRGARTITSVVHRENDAVFAVNQKLGGVFAPDPENLDYFVCVIAL